jgi:hypothetical protein
MVEALIEHHLVELLKNFDNQLYIDYMTKILRIVSSCEDEFAMAGIRSVQSRDLAGDIGYRAKFSFPVFVLLSHPICKFRSHRNYQLREPFFIAQLGLVPVFFSSLNQMTILKLWGNRADEFFNPSNAPLPETDITCWEFPVSDRRSVEYSSLNFVEQNDSQPEDAGMYLTTIFDKYLRLMYWLFPRHGFSPSTHFLFGRDRISSFVKISKSLFLVEKIGNPQTIPLEGKYIETRQIQVKGLTECNGEYFFDHFSALMDSELANEIMIRSNPESLFINGMLADIKYSGGRRNSILTLRADYALSIYDIVQSLIGIVLSRKFNDPSNETHAEDIDSIREGVANIFNDIQKDVMMPSTISDNINDLFGICLTQMFPVLVIDSRRVREVHPLIWSFLKQWNLLKNDTDQQKLILLNLLRVMESCKSFFSLSLSEEMEFFRKAGINKRELLKSILTLKRMIIAYKKFNYFFDGGF